MDIQAVARKLEKLDEREAINVAKLLVEHMRDRHIREIGTMDQLISRVNQGEPVQYLLGHTWFYGRKFSVTSDVLIPRPETEELVYWVIQDYKATEAMTILDIGTGSGCIAATLAIELPQSSVSAIDISERALEVARKNCKELNVEVDLGCLDFLAQKPPAQFDVIVSNPPYVSAEEMQELDSSVRQFEPNIALGHPSGDPLIFYREIATRPTVKSGGAIYVELNEFRAPEIEALFISNGFETEVREDMQGKTRMLKAWH